MAVHYFSFLLTHFYKEAWLQLKPFFSNDTETHCTKECIISSVSFVSEQGVATQAQYCPLAAESYLATWANLEQCVYGTRAWANERHLHCACVSRSDSPTW